MALHQIMGHLFLYGIKTSGVKIEKSWYYKINLQKQLQQLITFATYFIKYAWQGPEYASVSDFEYFRVLNMPPLHGALNVPEYTWIISEHAEICVNMSKSAWIALALFPHCNSLYTWRCSYLFQCLYETPSYSLKENEAVFVTYENQKTWSHDL